MAILSAVTAAELMLLWLGRSRLAGALPTIPIPLSQRLAGPLLVIGAGAATFALSRLAADGFTTDGRYPAAMALLYAAGVGLVSLDAVGLRRRIRA